MPLNIEACWSKPVQLTKASAGAIYACDDLDRLPDGPVTNNPPVSTAIPSGKMGTVTN
jgi:hypothetical protein